VEANRIKESAGLVALELNEGGRPRWHLLSGNQAGFHPKAKFVKHGLITFNLGQITGCPPGGQIRQHAEEFASAHLSNSSWEISLAR
jgi:hypothetical protein